MGVSEKTNCCALIREIREGIEIIEHITPLSGRIERGVHDGKVVHQALQRQAA